MSFLQNFILFFGAYAKLIFGSGRVNLKKKDLESVELFNKNVDECVFYAYNTIVGEDNK